MGVACETGERRETSPYLLDGFTSHLVQAGHPSVWSISARCPD